MSSTGVKTQTTKELPRSHQYIARQPILAADKKVIGFELLFRNGLDNFYSATDSNAASRSALDTAILVGLETLCDGLRAFVNCTREVLLKDYLTLLPPTRAALEILRNVQADDLAVAACQRMKAAGYMIALDDFGVDDPRQPLVALADILKVDMRHTSADQASALIQRYANSGRRLLAMKVETREEFVLAQQTGFALFQGYFFRKPEIMQARKLPVRQASSLRLLHGISRPELDFPELEDITKSDPGLCYRLLRYLDSPRFGLSHGILSLQHAFALMGDRELSQWIRLTATLVVAPDKPSDLVVSALVRARFCELLGRRIGHTNSDLFLLGLLSRMDAILEVPMGVVLENIAVGQEIKAVLLRQSSQLSPLYELMVAQEQADREKVTRFAAMLNVPENVVAECRGQAMEWAQRIPVGA